MQVYGSLVRMFVWQVMEKNKATRGISSLLRHAIALFQVSKVNVGASKLMRELLNSVAHFFGNRHNGLLRCYTQYAVNFPLETDFELVLLKLCSIFVYACCEVNCCIVGQIDELEDLLNSELR